MLRAGRGTLRFYKDSGGRRSRPLRKRPLQKPPRGCCKRIVRADAKLSKLLQVPRNAPQLEMTGRVVRLDGQTVHSSYQVGYGENFEFIVR